MDIENIIKTKEYQDARNRIRDWKDKLETADNAQTTEIGKGKKAFFEEMQKKNPALYAIFRIDDKTLNEMIFKKLTGMDVIID